MKNRLTTALRFAIAGLALVAGATSLNAPKMHASTPQVAMMNSAPVPMCPPSDPHCTIPGLGW